MGSEIFNLKSLYLEDTVVRGTRISLKNASSTRILKVNPEDESVVKTGETGINKEYLIQSSLLGNDLQGYGTFINNSNIVTGYTGAQNLSYSDKIKLNSDKIYYGISGIDGTNIYLTDKYIKENQTDPDVQTGSCSIVKYYLDSEKYESVDENIVYNKDESQWNVTGMQMSDPVIAPTGIFELDTGVSVQFQKATATQYPDIATILNVTKTLVDNNTSQIYDVSLSPLPYPHSSLQVYMGRSGEVLEKAEEDKDYIVNYSNGSEIIYPIPPYEERKVAYIKFLDKMDNEKQKTIDSSFNGNLVLNKIITENEVEITRPVSEIIPTDDFSIKVGDNTLYKNTDYLVDNDAGLVTFIEHSNSEELIDVLVYPKELIWDGISVIRGVTEEEVDNVNNLVIPGISGLEGIDHTVYFEDIDSNNLIRDTDFIIDPESGAFSLVNPLKSDEAVLVSYYVEGEDIDDEIIDLDMMQLKSFPLIVNSLVLTKKYSVISDDDVVETKTRILVEGTDYKIFYVTGYIELYPGDETTIELKASYTPMTQINCVAQSISNSTDYLFTIVDDVLSYTQEDVENEGLVFVVDNPVVSVPEKILFDENKVDSNYNFSGSLSPEDFIEVKTKDSSKIFNVTNLEYDNLKREITLAQTFNDVYPEDGDIVVSTYKFTSSTLPYAPILLIYTVINTGDTSFVIEGYDKTNLLRSGSILRIDNKDPQSSTYYKIKSVIYEKQNTTVNIYGSFSEDIIDPAFYIFDEALSWLSLSDDVSVDTTIPIDSDYLVFNGGSLFVSTNIKKDALLLLNNQDIYTITSVTINDDSSTIGIYPNLKTSSIISVGYTRLPIYEIGITTLPAEKLIIDDIEQPAFTLWYQSPEGFEGSAKILFLGGKLIIEEYVSGVKNPESYEYLTSNYSNIYTFAKAIQSTSSTFRRNVTYMDVPDYNPFTIVHSGKEQYYLGSGTWNPETLINFEEELFINLPYTFHIIPELTKYSLLEIYENSADFTIKDVDVSAYFSPGSVLAFINKISGDHFYTSVTDTEYLSGDTTVNISSIITEDMVSPYFYRYTTSTWNILYDTLIDIDYDNLTFTFSGNLYQNIRVGTLLFISDKYVYQVSSLTINSGNYQLIVNSAISSNLVIETYTGYVKYSRVPVVLDQTDYQPYVGFNYVEPENHIGYAEIKFEIDQITIKECVDNLSINENVYKYDNYESYSMLFAAITNTESIISGNYPFVLSINDPYNDINDDQFIKYTLPVRESFSEMSYVALLYMRAFKIDYTVPSGYTGEFQVKVTLENIYIKEIVIDSQLKRSEKETIINLSSDQTFLNLINIAIPDITSVVGSSIKPFSTTAYNSSIFQYGTFDTIYMNIMSDEYMTGPQVLYATIGNDSFGVVGNLNSQKLVIDTDYTIENGIIELEEGVSSLERYQLNYMGLDNRYEDENKDIICTCRFITTLPEGYRLDVYLEYQNIDQFYIQKLTERKFSEIVVVPQIETLVEQKGTAGGQGSDSGANNDAVANYDGGIADLSYLLHDEYIKKQLYLRFYKWYKERLRGLSAEMQLGLGFKFAHSNAAGLNGTTYSLDDEYVETEDYTLTTDSEIEQVENGYSKFFPIGYIGQAPDYYHRFKKECLSFNDVYCCNIRYKDNTNTIQTIGIIKSNQPYWSRTSDLNFYVWFNVEDNLVGDYEVVVPEDDLVFTPSIYSFLKVIDVGDKIKVDTFKNYYEISSIIAPDNRTYEYIILNTTFTEKGIKTYDIVNEEDIELDNLMDNLPPDGYRIWINRQNKENFPMSDDYGNLGATAYSESIEGLVRNTRRIRKPFLLDLLRLFFPLLETLEPTTNFTIMVKEDSEASWKELGSIDLSKLSFKEERNVDDVLDALRYNFTEKYIVPSIPPYTVYDIKESDDQGFYRYFYLSLEKVYDSSSEDGYYQSIVLRAKNRNWYFKIVNGGEEDIIEDYGFSASKEYKNFYDSENIYKKLLLEKQAWQTEELIVRDLYDYSDKIARAFNQGNLNRENSQYRNYLAMPNGGSTSGISDILKNRIISYQSQISFLASTDGPVYRVLYPDKVHAEDSASTEIATTFTQTYYAWNLYNTFYSKMLFYYQLNDDNNDAWKNNYVRWVMSLEEGIIPQKLARQMYRENGGILTLGLYELPMINISLFAGNINNAYVTVSSTYTGKYLQIVFNIGSISNTCTINLYSIKVIGNASNVIYKSINEVCSEINSYTYNNSKMFNASNIYEYYENDVVSNTCIISNQVINPVSGLNLYATNVADHRASDPRILFLNKNIEDRMYTHEIRELPGFTLSYLGNYYLLKYGSIGLTISVNYGYYYTDLKYGVFMGESGKEILSLSFTLNNETVYRTFELYSITNSRYKTLGELSAEIGVSGEFICTVPYTYTNTTCDYIIVTSNYIAGVDDVVSVYITTNTAYSNLSNEANQFYYRMYKDEEGITKLDIVFYSLIVDGNLVYKSTTILDTFTFSFQKSDLSFKKLSEFCSELSAFTFQGEPILSAASVYEYDPGSDLSTTFVVLDQNLKAIGYDWIASIYVDTYSITLSNTDEKAIPEAKNAVFSFPMYTANGNEAKQAIEGIPVSGTWSDDTSGNVLELSCIDGEEWSVTFTDYDSGDYKSYMVPKSILDAINSGQTITEAQYNQIRVVEDQPQISVLKELVLTRISEGEEISVKYNLRQYGTLNELIDVILATRFNSSGEVDDTANRIFFIASLIGTTDIEGMYKSNELYAEYIPVIKSFTVQMENGNTVYKSNELIGWEIRENILDVTLKYNVKMSEKRYSYDSNHTFNTNSPSKAYIDTLYNFPQGFRRDILGFDIYSWDYNASYIVRNDWIYFKSDSVSYIRSGDLGQPDKTIGYGIPLAGSGHSMAPDNETLGELINRLNNNTYINKWFYINLKFTRNDNVSPGYFEYDYLPNHSSDIPKSKFDNIKLKNGPLISIGPTDDYTFTGSNITINSVTKRLDISCNWEMGHLFEYIFFFNDPSIVTIGDLVSSINTTLSEQIANSLIEGFVIGGLASALCTTLVPTYSTKSFSSGGTFVDQSLPVYVGSGTANALGLRVRSATGSNFVISSATYLIPNTQDRLVLTIDITYQDSYAITGYDISSLTALTLSYYLSSLKPYTDDIFPYLFSAEPVSDGFSYFNASLLLSTSKSISTGSVNLDGELSNSTAFRVLNMSSGGTLRITESTIELITTKVYTADITGEEIPEILNQVQGDYNEGFLSCEVLAVENNEIDKGYLYIGEYTLTSNNTPAHVYFGIMGDIKFIQISDHNLHVQYNYIKERLGMPWRDSSGNLKYDYYTPEMYNENNPCAIDLANFLGYLRTTRYNQIKNSVINEGIVSNKYLWLYMKFHKEFGCDQQVSTIKNLIQKNEEDIETLDQIL